MISADSRAMVDQAPSRSSRSGAPPPPGVIECLDEAGEDLFTFLRFPPSQWKALRTTNALERINEEFRRRTKTQASLPGQAVFFLFRGVLRGGRGKLRKMAGWQSSRDP